MSKLGLKKVGDENILIYQHNDSGPVMGEDKVIVHTTVVECVREFADWYEQTYEPKK